MSASILCRAVNVVDAVSKNVDGLRFTDIQALLGNISPTTVSKILKELTLANVLMKSPEGRYLVGMKAYFWGKTVSERSGPIQTVRQHMTRLQDEFKASVNLFTCYDANMFCLESLSSPESPSLWPAGKSLALQLPVIGSIFFFDRSQLEKSEFLEDQCVQHSPQLRLQAVRKMIDEAFINDLQYDRGLFYPGIYRLAIPLRKKGGVVMVLGIGIFQTQKKSINVTKIAAALRQAQKAIEYEFNHQ